MARPICQIPRRYLQSNLSSRSANVFLPRPLFSPSVLRRSSCARGGVHESKNGDNKKKCHAQKQQHHEPISPTTAQFWSSRQTWGRASINTLRCLVGCTLGDFGAMWFLQLHHPELGMGTIMAISVASGISSSLLLETVLLRVGKDRLPWAAAARTAAGMSLISMITMELAENAVDYYLTGGTVAVNSTGFWVAAVVSMAAGFAAPLPYNYVRLRRFGKACH